MKRVILDLDEKTKKKVRIYAAQTDRTIKEVFVDAVNFLMEKKPASNDR